MKPVLYVDIDGVVADSPRWWLTLYNRKYGTHTRLEEITEYDWRKRFPYGIEQFYHNYVGVRPIPDAFESLWQLEGKYRIVFATAGYGYDWISSYQIGFRDVDYIHIKDKSLLRGFALIDDNPMNLDVFSGHRFLLSQPWNTGRGLNDTSWAEITEFLLKI